MCWVKRRKAAEGAEAVCRLNGIQEVGGSTPLGSTNRTDSPIFPEHIGGVSGVAVAVQPARSSSLSDRATTSAAFGNMASGSRSSARWALASSRLRGPAP